MTINPAQPSRDPASLGGEKLYYLVTLGCQMNEHDSEIAAATLDGLGYLPATRVEEADLILINTCAVRKKPEDKVSSLLGRYRELKENRPNLLIAVGGCMTQQKEAATYIKKRFPHVGLIFGTHALARLPELLARAGRSNKTVVDLTEDYGCREDLPRGPAKSYRAWLPVTYGCNNFCSYCVVPHVRGRERSRDPQKVIAEANNLAAGGCLEITLLGQNVNSYGRDLPVETDFATLLRNLNTVEGLERIRFMTSHPKDLSPDLVAAVAEGERVCEHFHLPVQSGSDRILDQMNRRYSHAHYLELLEMIRSAIPGVAITSDVIVGFPGETDADHGQTLTLLEQACFDNIFSFIYAPRKNTAAARLPDNVDITTKKKRLRQINLLQQKISRERNCRLLGQVVEVLVEEERWPQQGVQTGRTRTNKLVHFKVAGIPAGRLLMVKITAARTWNLEGNPV